MRVFRAGAKLASGGLPCLLSEVLGDFPSPKLPCCCLTLVKAVGGKQPATCFGEQGWVRGEHHADAACKLSGAKKDPADRPKAG